MAVRGPAGKPLPPLRGVPRAAVVPRHPHGDSVRKHYRVVEEIGRGAFSRVTLVQERATEEERACKVVSTTGMPAETVEMLRKEVQFLCALDHPHIIKLYEYAEDCGRLEFVLVLEYVPGGDCSTLLRDAGFRLAEQIVKRIARQVLLALSYCHAQEIVHRDVKPENIMLTEASPWQAPDCKLIDFGLAARCDRPLPEVVGTPPYIAPEVIAGCQNFTYTPKGDVWALGVSVLELLAGANPFGRTADYGGNPEGVFERIRKYDNLDSLTEVLREAPSWQGRSAEASDFHRHLLCVDLGKRLEAADALKHQWLKKSQATLVSVTPEMLRGLSCFPRVPLLARYCLYIIAARLNVPDSERFGAAFLSLDADADGRLSRQELVDALPTGALGSWCGGGRAQAVNVDELLQAADMDGSGDLSFTEFVAACLSGRHGSLEDLVTSAFDALDVDRDGFVDVAAIRAVFRECEFPLLHRLPQDRPFDLEEWVQRFTGRRPPPCGRVTKPRAVQPLGFFDRLLDHFNCTPCKPADRVEYIVAPTERLVASAPPPIAAETAVTYR